jgi:hypothetical protein
MTRALAHQARADAGPVPSTVPSSLLRRHPVATFFVLTYAVAWALWLPLVVLQDRISPALDLVLRILGSATPSVLAIILVARIQGRGEVRRLLRRLLKARVGIGWYAAIVALTALPVAAVWVSTWFGAPAPTVDATVVGVLVLFQFSIFPGSAMGEKSGGAASPCPGCRAATAPWPPV